MLEYRIVVTQDREYAKYTTEAEAILAARTRWKGCYIGKWEGYGGQGKRGRTIWPDRKSKETDPAGTLLGTIVESRNL